MRASTWRLRKGCACVAWIVPPLPRWICRHLRVRQHFRLSSARQELVCEGTTSRRIWEIQGLCPIFRLSMKNRSAGVITPRIVNSLGLSLHDHPPLPSLLLFVAATCERVAGQNTRVLTTAVFTTAVASRIISIPLECGEPPLYTFFKDSSGSVFVR